MEKKHTAQFKYVVKSVLSVITIPPWCYAKYLVLRGYWNASEVGYIINNILAFKYIVNMETFDLVEWETQLWFQFRFSLNLFVLACRL